MPPSSVYPIATSSGCKSGELSQASASPNNAASLAFAGEHSADHGWTRELKQRREVRFGSVPEGWPKALGDFAG